MHLAIEWRFMYESSNGLKITLSMALLSKRENSFQHFLGTCLTRLIGDAFIVSQER